MNPVSAPWAVVALLLATTAWGSMFLVAKPMVAQLDPVWFTTLRYALACLPLAWLVHRHGQAPWSQLRRHRLRLTLLGLGGYGLFSSLCFYGPPGTGKTTCIVEMLHQIYAADPHARVLVVSQQNSAVDNAPTCIPFCAAASFCMAFATVVPASKQEAPSLSGGVAASASDSATPSAVTNRSN